MPVLSSSAPDASLCHVFDMLTDRLSRIEEEQWRSGASQEHASDLRPRGSVLSGLLHSDMPVRIKKHYDGMLASPWEEAVVVEVGDGVLRGARPLATREWACSKTAGRHDAALRAAWGDEVFESLRTVCAHLYTTDPGRIYMGWAELKGEDVQRIECIERIKKGAKKKKLVGCLDETMYETAVMRRVPELLALGPHAMMFAVNKEEGPKSMRDVVVLVRRVFEVMGKDVKRDGRWDVYRIESYSLAYEAFKEKIGVDERHLGVINQEEYIYMDVSPIEGYKMLAAAVVRGHGWKEEWAAIASSAGIAPQDGGAAVAVAVAEAEVMHIMGIMWRKNLITGHDYVLNKLTGIFDV